MSQHPQFSSAITPLKLPRILPSKESMLHTKKDAGFYTPEIWEFEYTIKRYLEDITDESLRERYHNLLRNMRSLICLSSHSIPITISDSSWYWFRKEHQTRLEFKLRKLDLPTPQPIDEVFETTAHAAPAEASPLLSGDKLYRFCEKQYLDPLVLNGKLRIGLASRFASMEGDIARQDEELIKKSYSGKNYSTVRTMDGIDIPLKSCIQYSSEFPNYYVYCLATDWHNDLFETFEGSNCCAIVHDFEAFSIALEKAAKQTLPPVSDPDSLGFLFHHNPVNYYDPYERPSEIDAAMSKDFKFAYQREYRYIWLYPSSCQELETFHELTLDQGFDSITLHDRP